MSRPEAAMEPSMEEILASIRKIISEEPATSVRPKPVDRPAPMAASPSEPATARRPEPPRASIEWSVPSDPEKAPPAPSSPRAAPAVPPPPASPAISASDFDPADPFAAPHVPPSAIQATDTPPPEPAQTARRPEGDSNALYGRLAEALRSGAEPRATTTAPANKAPPPTSAAPVLDDLDDLLSDTPARPQATGDVKASEKPPAMDLGAVIPSRGQAPGADQEPVTSAILPDAASPPDAPQENPYMSARTEALKKKMLEARTGRTAASGREELSPDDAPAEAEAPQAISLLASPADDQPATASDEPVEIELAVGDAERAATADADVGQDHIDDPEGSEAVKSAFGALVAGLAASSASTGLKAEEQAPPSVVRQDEPDKGADRAETAAQDDGAGDAQGASAGHSAPDAAPAPKVVAASLPFATAAAVSKPDAAQADLAAASSKPEPKPASDQAAPLATSPADVKSAEADPASAQPVAAGLPQVAASAGLVSGLPGQAGTAVGVRTVEDIVAELLRPMLREWLAENMPRMVEKALRIELADGLKTINQPTGAAPSAKPKGD